MEKRIELERRGTSPSKVKSLNLDNCRSTNIVGLDESYSSLESLSLNSVGLTSLKGFPALPSLRRLELSDNRIRNGLHFLGGSPKISHLVLSGNKIKDLEALEPLKNFTKLKNLDLFNNDVTNIEDYKAKVFALHPSLVILDGLDRNDHDAEDSDDSDDDEELNGNDDGNSDDEFLGVSGSEEDGDDEDKDISLSAVYNDQLEEELSESSVYEGGEEEEDEDALDDDDEEGEVGANAVNNIKKPETTDDSPRGKKRKLEEESEPNN